MTETSVTVFLNYVGIQSLIYALLSWEPLVIHYFSSLFSHVIESELKTQLNNQHTAFLVLGYLTIISSCIMFVSSKCLKNVRFFYYFYSMILFLHSVTFIYSIYISVMTFCNLTYIKTDKFTEFLREIFSVSASGMQIHLECCGFMNATIEYNNTLPYSCCKDYLGCTFEKIHKTACKDSITLAFDSLIKSIGGVAIASSIIELGFFLAVIYLCCSIVHESSDSSDSSDSSENDVNPKTECIAMEP